MKNYCTKSSFCCSPKLNGLDEMIRDLWILSSPHTTQAKQYVLHYHSETITWPDGLIA